MPFLYQKPEVQYGVRLDNPCRTFPTRSVLSTRPRYCEPGAWSVQHSVTVEQVVAVTYFIKWSMKVCSDTSSVKIVCAERDVPPYVLVVCVVDGLSLESRNRAWEPLASQIIKRGNGNRSCTSSYCVLATYWKSHLLVGAYPGIFSWLVENCLEVLIALLLLVASFPPFSHGFAVEDEDLEEGVKEENMCRLYRS